MNNSPHSFSYFWKLSIAAIAGAALPFAFSPYSIYGIAFLAPAALFFICLETKPWQALLLGLAFGIGLFSVGTSWIYISIHHFGNASSVLAIAITAFFSLFFALYYALQMYLCRRLFQHKPKWAQCLLIFPAFWVVFEVLRGSLFTGFPWLFLGYTQIDTPLRGMAPLIGVYGLSLATACISGALALLAHSQQTFKTKLISAVLIFFLLGAGWLLRDYHWTHPSDKPIQTSVVQGNISQTLKWNRSELIRILNIYKDMTQKHWESRLIIWPEAAVPAYPQEIGFYFDLMNTLAKQHGDYLIIGSPIYHKNANAYYNGLTMVGAGNGQYLKRHLVPFGEYTPLPSIYGRLMKHLSIPMSDFSPGPEKQPLLSVNQFNIAAFICYEIAYPMDVLRYSKHAQMIINISDDSWFGRSKALWQQAEMGQMRALETGRPVILNANTGVSAFITPLGKITQKTTIDTRVVLTQSVTPMSGNTPLMKWGYYPLFGLLIALICLALFL